MFCDLEMKHDHIPKTVSMDTTTTRRHGQPKTTWQQTLTAQLKETGETCVETQHDTQHAARDRNKMRQIVDALYPTGDRRTHKNISTLTSLYIITLLIYFFRFKIKSILLLISVKKWFKDSWIFIVNPVCFSTLASASVRISWVLWVLIYYLYPPPNTTIILQTQHVCNCFLLW